MSKILTLGKKYGYNDEYKDFFFSTNKQIPRYSFQILTTKGKDYWYAQRRDENGKIRKRYLGRCFEGLDRENNNSFQVALNKLIERFNESFVSGTNDKRPLTYFIDLFIKDCERRLNDKNDATYSRHTIQRHKNSITQYRKFINEFHKKTRLVHTKNEHEYRETIKDYIEYLKDYTKQSNDKPLSFATIRNYVRGVKIFHNWLEDKSFGGGYVENNPINNDWIKSAFRRYGLNYSKSRPRDNRLKRISGQYYSKEGYNQMIEDCIDNIRRIWIEYNKSGKIPREYNNQPKNQVGSGIVYFISLFQLVLGFRVGEILNSFRNIKHYEDFVINPTDSGSFWYRHQDGTWIIEVNWKGKHAVIPTNDIDQFYIRSWDKPKFWKGKPSGNNGKEDFYDTHLVDICYTLFQDSPYLFTAYRNTYKHYSYSQYNNNFKELLIGKYGWDRYGVDTTHDLRHYFITYHIQRRTDPLLISQITRHSLSTMMRFYKEENVDFQRELVKDIGIKLGKYKPRTNVPTPTQQDYFPNYDFSTEDSWKKKTKKS